MFLDFYSSVPLVIWDLIDVHCSKNEEVKGLHLWVHIIKFREIGYSPGHDGYVFAAAAVASFFSSN